MLKQEVNKPQANGKQLPTSDHKTCVMSCVYDVKCVTETIPMRKNITSANIVESIRIGELKEQAEKVRKQLRNTDLLQRLAKIDLAITDHKLSTLRDSLQANQEELYSPFNQHCYADA